MAAVNIYWGDGTSDKITCTFSGNVGSSQMAVASDPNKFLITRTKNITLKSSGGATLGILTVSQQPRSRAYSVAYNESYK
jgi:hypothetical protein